MSNNEVYFSFSEINYGSIEIESGLSPTRGEVIEEFMIGNAYFKHTEFVNIETAIRLFPRDERRPAVAGTPRK